MRSLVFLLLAVSFAGCLQSDGGHSDIAPTYGDASPEPFLSVLSRVSDDVGRGEPSLGVTPDGVLFTNVNSLVHRSMDDGRTWENLGDPAAPIPNNDPDLAVDLDGNVWESRLYALLCNEVSVSRDLGESWSTFPVVCNGPVGDRQYVVPTEGGIAYLYWHQIPTFHQTVMKTTDYGQTWLPMLPAESPDHHLVVNEGSSWGGGGFHNAATGSTFITYTNTPGAVDVVVDIAEETPSFSVTRDGLTWEQGHGPTFTGGRVGLGLVMGAADAAGNVYLTWAEIHGDDMAAYIAGSQDDGRTWTEKIRVDDGNGSLVFPAIAAGADGHVAVAYYEGDQQTIPDQMEGNWTVTLDWTTDFWGEQIWSQGPLANGTVREGPMCLGGTTCTGDREFLDYFALDVMPDGRVVTTYNTLQGDELRNWFAMTAEPLLGAS